MIEDRDLRELFARKAGEMEIDEGIPRELVKRARRRQGLMALIGSVTVVSLGVLAWTGIGSSARPDAIPPARNSDREVDIAPTDNSAPYFVNVGTGEKAPLPESLFTENFSGFSYTPSPDGTRVVYDTAACGPGSWLKVANIDGTDAHRIAPRQDGFVICGGVGWSPDGTQLVYQQKRSSSLRLGNLFVHELNTNRRTRLTDLRPSTAAWWFTSPTFSPDGRSVIFHQPRSASQNTEWDVWSVPATGGEPRLVLRNAAFPAYFPNGEIAFVSGMTSNFTGQRISITSADGRGSRRTLVEANDSIWYPRMSPDGTKIAYEDGGSIQVVEVSTGVSSEVADGSQADWLDSDTLIVVP